ncbi:MAG: hypothetical protein H6Q51_56 [Deltaproteobacteria bacterium]|jgi:hypothetical protein|nr:hypothetical protein [Deltaproteobacteria bacterium]
MDFQVLLKRYKRDFERDVAAEITKRQGYLGRLASRRLKDLKAWRRKKQEQNRIEAKRLARDGKSRVEAKGRLRDAKNRRSAV